MKRSYTLITTAVLVVSSVLGFVLAAGASAAEWLANGAAIATAEPSEAAGNVLFEDNKVLGSKQAFLCSFILDGTVGPGAAGLIIEVLNLAKEKIAELSGLALLGTGAGSDCVTESLCAEGSSTSPIEVWPLKLPWDTELMAGGIVLILGFGYDLLCLVAGLNVEDSCTTAEASFEVENDADTGDAAIKAGSTDATGTCSVGGVSDVSTVEELTSIILTSGALSTIS